MPGRGRILVYIVLTAAAVYAARSLDAGLVGALATFLGLALSLGLLERRWMRRILRG